MRLSERERAFLKKYERLYRTFDPGHGPKHMRHVREMAEDLAQKHAPELARLARIAATLHDVGIMKGREGHEESGVKILKQDPAFREQFTPAERRLILHAVGQHRATTGAPRTTLAKIIADADRTPDLSGMTPLQRAIEYRKAYMPELGEREALLDAAKHLNEKYGPGGVGRRTYFPETEQAIVSAFAPILKAYKKHDIEALKKLLEGK